MSRGAGTRVPTPHTNKRKGKKKEKEERNTDLVWRGRAGPLETPTSALPGENVQREKTPHRKKDGFFFFFFTKDCTDLIKQLIFFIFFKGIGKL